MAQDKDFKTKKSSLPDDNEDNHPYCFVKIHK